MADNTENVRYSFEGDVKSLKQATETAIQLLDDYQKAVAQAVSDSKFNASTRSTQTFNNAIKKTIKDVEKMAAKLKQVGDVRLPSGSDTTKALASTMATVARQTDNIANATKVTTKDLTQFRTELNAVRTTLAGVAPQVDTLVASEQKFQDVLSMVSARAQQVRTTMENMQSRLGSTFDPITNKVKSLSDVFNNIKTKVQSFKDKVVEAFSRAGLLSSTVASAFRRTSTEADNGDASAGRFARALERLSTAFVKLKSGVSGTGSSFGALFNKLGSLGSRASKTNSSFKSLHATTGLLSKAFIALTGVRIGDWLADAAKQSIAYIENLNLFTVAMGDAVDKGTAFVETMQELYGMDPSNLMRYAGNFYQLATAIDMPDEAATNLSLSLTKATNDISSLFNVDIESVFNDLSSGMQGMSRAVRKYGMDIRTTTLQQTALSLGITKQVESMSEANRQGLRYLTMMRQTSNATGDFARTIETPANQLKIFKEQITQLGRAIGNFLIGPLGTVIRYVNGFIMAMRTALVFVAELMGLVSGASDSFDTSGADDEAKAISGIGSAASSAAKKVKNFLAPFDELTILQDKSKDSDGGGGVSADLMDPAIASAIADIGFEFENVRMKANQVRDSILEFLGFKIDAGKIITWDASELEANLINKFPQWSKTIQATFRNWGSIVEGFKNVVRSIGNVFRAVIDKVKSYFSELDADSTFATFIESLSTSLNNLSSWIDSHTDGLANLVITIGSLAAAFALLSRVGSIVTTVSTAMSPLFTIVAKLSPMLQALGTSIGGLSLPVVAVVAAIAAVVAILVHLWNTSDSFRESIVQGISSLMDVLTSFWDNLLQPIFSNVATSIGQLWSNDVKPIIDSIIDIIGNLVEALMGLWNNVLAPLIAFLVSAWGPSIANVFNAVWDAISAVCSSILGAIAGVLQIFNGLLSFLAGVFTGDWNRAWKGIANVFVGIANTIISAFEFVVNAVIGLINSMISLVHGAIVGLINSILGAVNGIAKLLGKDLSLRVTAKPPKIPQQRWGRVPELARGGVVTSPTLAMIGEGKYDEAVIPLGDSPQLNELVAKITDAISQERRDERPVHVHVYVDGREITTSQNNSNRMYGKVQQNN